MNPLTREVANLLRQRPPSSATITMESFSYPQFSPDVSSVHIALFKNVTNASQLKQRLISAATMPGPEGELERAAVNFAFIDARLVRPFF